MLLFTVTSATNRLTPGDAFLKYLSSVYVFVTNPSLSEGNLHVSRQKIISNKSLLSHASRIGMPAYIQSKVFAYKAWQPPNFRVHIPPRPAKVFESVDAPELKTKDGEEGENAVVLDEVPTQREPPPDMDETMGDDDGMDNFEEESAVIMGGESPQGEANTPPMQSLDLEELKLPEEVIPNANQEPPPASPTARGSSLIDGNFEQALGAALGIQGKTKKKPKPKKKRAADDQGTQWLGDKVCCSEFDEFQENIIDLFLLGDCRCG